MGRVYTAVIDAVSVSAVCDLFWAAASSDCVVAVKEIGVYQDASETSEQLPIMLFRTVTDNSAVGTANTPAPHALGDPAYSGVVRTNITGGSLATESTVVRRETFNILNGWHYLPAPEDRILLTPSTGGASAVSRLVVKLDAAPSAALTISAFLTLEEMGG